MRDPQLRQTEEGNQWFFGMKAHIRVDQDSGLVHMVVSTVANVTDVTQTSKLLRSKGRATCADADHMGADNREELKKRACAGTSQRDGAGSRHCRKAP